MLSPHSPSRREKQEFCFREPFSKAVHPALLKGLFPRHKLQSQLWWEIQDSRPWVCPCVTAQSLRGGCHEAVFPAMMPLPKLSLKQRGHLCTGNLCPFCQRESVGHRRVLGGKGAKARFLCPKKNVFTADSCMQRVTVHFDERFKNMRIRDYWLWMKTKWSSSSNCMSLPDHTGRMIPRTKAGVIDLVETFDHIKEMSEHEHEIYFSLGCFIYTMLPFIPQKTLKKEN